jgi:hypothetical protein
MSFSLRRVAKHVVNGERLREACEQDVRRHTRPSRSKSSYQANWLDPLFPLQGTDLRHCEWQSCIFFLQIAAYLCPNP